jgi:biotin transport system substrate-specific component
MAAAAQIAIPLPFTPVPLTGQTFAALLVGGAYGAPRAATAMLAYLAIGAAGAPVFASGSGGTAAFASPSAGYLVGMLAASALVGAAADRGWDRRLLTSLVMMLVGSVVIYLVGATWLAQSLHVDMATAFDLGVRPFLVGDALKLAGAGALLPGAWTLMARLDRG